MYFERKSVVGKSSRDVGENRNWYFVEGDLYIVFLKLIELDWHIINRYKDMFSSPENEVRVFIREAFE